MLGVAKIGQMAGFAASPEPGFLGLDKIADFDPLAKLRSGSNAGKRSKLTTGIDSCAFDYGVGFDHNTITELAVSDHRSRTDRHIATETDTAFQNHVDVNKAVFTCDDVAPYVQTLRICQRHPGRHQRLSCPLLIDAFELRKLTAIIDTRDVARILHRYSRNGDVAGDRKLDQIGEIELALNIFRLDVRQQALHRRRVERQNAGVDFPYCTLCFAGIRVLDDGFYRSHLATDNAPELSRIVEDRRHQRTLAPGRNLKGARQRLMTDQRNIAIYHEYGTRILNARQRLGDRVPGAQLFRCVTQVMLSPNSALTRSP